MMHYWNLLWDWNSVESVRKVHSFFEGWALLFFAILVLFDVLAHLTEDEHKARSKRLERVGLWCFGVAVVAEILAYPYSQRNDALSSQQDATQKERIARLDNSTQALRTDAEKAHTQAEQFKAQIADANARAKAAEGQAATAKADVAVAMATVATADARIAEAQRGATEAEARAQEARSMAEAERLERVRLEAIVAPRSLSIEQQRQITDVCRKFVGHRAVISSYGLDLEGAALGGQLIAMLRVTLGIDNVFDQRASTMVTGAFELGVHVRGPAAEQDFITALSGALNSIGHLQVSVNDAPPRPGATIVGGGQTVSPGVEPINVAIGIKPVPTLPAR
jgi:hypothetical protein